MSMLHINLTNQTEMTSAVELFKVGGLVVYLLLSKTRECVKNLCV